MSNILLITMDFPPLGGGISIKAHDLAVQWAKSGNRVTVLTKIQGESSEYYTRKVIKLGGHYLWQAVKLSKVIKSTVRENNIQKIFCMSWSPDATGVLLSKVYKHCRWGISANGFDILDGIRTARNRFLMKQVFKRADKIFPPCESLKNKIEVCGDFSRKTSIIPNSVDLEKFSNKVSGNEIKEKYRIQNKKIIMTLCRLHPIKGVDILIQGFSKVYEEFKDIVLLIVGDGPSKSELEKQVLELNIKDNIIFTGWIPHEKTPGYYEACDIYVLPSRIYKGREEGQPIAVIEAALSSRPVVASNTGGIGEVIEDEVNGFLVSPEDAHALAEKIKKLLEDPDLAEKMGKAGREIAASRFDIKVNARKILEELDG